MKKLAACVCLFFLFPVFSLFVNGVSACEKRISSGVVCSAVAVLDERTASFVFPKESEKNWIWYRETTRDDYAEYLWEVSLDNGEASPDYRFGAYLFKFPGAVQGKGSLTDLLRTAQHSVAERGVNSFTVREDMETRATVRDDAVNVLIKDPATFDLLFRSRPTHACFQFIEPGKEPVICRAKIEYRLGSKPETAP